MRIDVLEYATLENYLADFVEKSRSERPTWSISGWAKRLGLKSTTSISKIICGQRTCGPVVSAALVKYFNFTEIEKRHFQYLIQKTKLAQDHPTRGLIETEILTGVKSRKTIILTEIQMSEVRNWYFLAIRQLAQLTPIIKDEIWLRKKLSYEGEANLLSVCEKLHELGFLQESESNYIASDVLLLSENEISSESIKQYHEEMGSIGIKAIRKFGFQERSMQACTLKIDKNKLNEAKQLIEKFMGDFESMTDSKDGNAVYQLNLQFFPLALLDV